MSDGFPERYPDDVVRNDAVRRAEIPWVQCDGKISKDLKGLCIIGDATVQPDLLLWGDSHMLAWAPGFDVALKALGRSAYFAPNSACPPILDVDQSTRPMCRSQNDDLAYALTVGGNNAGKVSTVVIAGFWKVYFNDSHLKISSEERAGGNFQVASRQLVSTIERLANEGVETLVMGPVPVYPVDVPYVVSSGRGKGTQLRYADVQSTNEYKALRRLPGFVDVAAWFCAEECRVQDEGGVFYRDAHHLSVHGARNLQGQLAQMLTSTHQARAAH